VHRLFVSLRSYANLGSNLSKADIGNRRKLSALHFRANVQSVNCQGGREGFAPAPFAERRQWKGGASPTSKREPTEVA
jgi:23S rRNA A1618 N6-methylase RlmF